MPRTSTNPCCTYDFTSFNIDTDAAKALLKQHCKKWTFQLETSSAGTPHLQGRLSLKVKKRLNQVIEIFQSWHLSITSKTNRDNSFYVTKEDTRIDGPWSDTDIEIPRHLREREWFPWQQTIIDSAEIYDENHINCVVDNEGMHGKSTVAHYIAVNGIGHQIPALNSSKDIMRMVMNKTKRSLYVVDVPRAIGKANMSEFWAGLESVKSGYAWDDRYSFKDEYFDRPQLWVFTNEKPPIQFLTKSRWKLYTINSNKEFSALTL